MANDNGHSIGVNGHALAVSDGGHGGGTPSPSLARYESRRIMAAMDEACAHGVPIGRTTVEEMQKVIDVLLADKRPRYRLAGQRAAQKALEYNLHRFEVADKLGRLDVGAPTDRVEHQHALKVVSGVREDAL